jgi:hypothetical protein
MYLLKALLYVSEYTAAKVVVAEVAADAAVHESSNRAAEIFH